jgi:hypothetical protein
MKEDGSNGANEGVESPRMTSSQCREWCLCIYIGNRLTGNKLDAYVAGQAGLCGRMSRCNDGGADLRVCHM